MSRDFSYVTVHFSIFSCSFYYLYYVFIYLKNEHSTSLERNLKNERLNFAGTEYYETKLKLEEKFNTRMKIKSQQQ